MFLTDGWTDYEVLDCGGGEKLERWGQVCLRRPDPQAIWPARRPEIWGQAEAWYHRSERGGGNWEFMKPLPERWTLRYRDLSFYVRPTGFKHTGLFPEQAVNWDWFSSLIHRAVKKGRSVKVLNLFAYTGGATLAAAAAGASVTHVDASKGMVGWAKENAAVSGLDAAPVRWLVDDCAKFVQREIRRGNHYDAIIMDPPSYGRGPNKEIWKIEDAVFPLIKDCAALLSEQPLFFLINSYTTGLQPGVLTYMLGSAVAPGRNGTVRADEIGLPVTGSGFVLPCGASGRWEAAEI